MHTTKNAAYIKRLKNVHPRSRCAGRACVIHNPSDHHMRNWPLNFRNDTGQMERLCPEHGTGHPDPDDLAWQITQGRQHLGLHGCCGCCDPDFNTVDPEIIKEAADNLRTWIEDAP